MKKLRRPILASLGALLAGACSPARMLNAVAPSEGVTTRTDLAYAPGPRHGVDIYAPAEARNAPVVVFFYGGSWANGSRSLYRFLGAALAAQGVVCMVPDYRLYPEIRSPAFLEDAAAATAWAHANAAEHGGDPGKILLMGHSAGAQMAVMLGLNPAWLGAHGLHPARHLKGVIGLSGPYDFLPLQTPRLRDIFGPEDTWPASQPINFVSPGAPPMFLGNGADDAIVLPRNTTRLAEKLRAAGNVVEAEIYPGVGHAPLIGAFAGPLGFIAPVRRDVLRFITQRSAA